MRLSSLTFLCLLGVTSADRLAYNYQPYEQTSITNGLGTNINIRLPSLKLLHTAPKELTTTLYYFVAPDDNFEQSGKIQENIDKIKRKIRVIFIKAPENRYLQNALLKLAKHATEEKTAIYVFSKQHDVAEFARNVQLIRERKLTKPKVRFVKYRTLEDAQHAQLAIQKQYDMLGGTFRMLNEGVNPVMNFANSKQSPEVRFESQRQQQQQYSTIPTGIDVFPGSSYLPPSTHKV